MLELLLPLRHAGLGLEHEQREHLCLRLRHGLSPSRTSTQSMDQLGIAQYLTASACCSATSESLDEARKAPGWLDDDSAGPAPLRRDSFV